MARLLLAWELGTGLGHAMPLAQLAEILLDRGHEVHLAWKDLTVGEALPPRLFADPRLHWWQAPVWLHRTRDVPDPATYPELLLHAGYGEPDRLLGCARGWQRLFDAIGPDLLVADHAPTALLVARQTPMRVAMFGNGFGIPPAFEPMVRFRDWGAAVDADRLAASEARVLRGCNAILGALGKAPLGALRELLLVDEHFLLGWPELDHHRSLRGDRPLPCWGWPAPPRGGLAAPWPGDPAAPRLLVYLGRDHPAIGAVLSALREGPWSSVVQLAGSGQASGSHGSSDRLVIVDRMLDLHSALADADLLIDHGGSGISHAALQAGVPLLMLPTQAEQLLLARRIAACGAGIAMWPGEVDARLSTAIAAMLGSPGFAAAAGALARRQPIAAADVLPRIADRCEALSAPAR